MADIDLLPGVGESDHRPGAYFTAGAGRGRDRQQWCSRSDWPCLPALVVADATAMGREERSSLGSVDDAAATDGDDGMVRTLLEYAGDLLDCSVSGIGFEPWKVSFFGVSLAVPYSVIIGHVAFNISFVAIVVRARLAQMDNTLEKAAHDLYANTWKTFWRVTFPMMLPGIIGGALLAFTLSLDDFVITFFTSGAGFNTLPVRVYGMIKKGVTPKINAVSTLMVAFSLLLILISLVFRKGGDKDTPIDLGL